VNVTYPLKEYMQTSGLELTNVIFTSTLVSYCTDLSMREYGQPSILPLDLGACSRKVKNINSCLSSN
jgi:hypothetical protein